MRSTVLPENRYWADYYLKNVWPVAYELIKSFRPANVPDHVEAKFQEYADYEESRIRKNLEDIRFDIDALDTVYVVAGPGRIEKVCRPFYRSSRFGLIIAKVPLSASLPPPQT